MSDQLFVICVKSIKIWPKINSSAFPILPSNCNFIIFGRPDGRFKLDVNGKIYTYEDYINCKKALKITN